MDMATYIIGQIAAVASLILIKNIISTILEKRKRDVTKDEQDFLDWMVKIPYLKEELEVVSCGEVQRWRIKTANEDNRIFITDYKYRNYITIKSSGEIFVCDSIPVDEFHESVGASFIIYDFRTTKELSKFKRNYKEIVTALRVQEELKEEEIRYKRGTDIIMKARRG